MARMIDDNAYGGTVDEMAEDDKRLDVRFTVEPRLNHAMMTKIKDINIAHEDKAQLLDVAGKFDEGVAERAKKLSDEPVYRDIEFITIRIPGDKTLVVHRPIMAADKHRFRAKYEAFKSARGQEIDGTPIETLPEVKPSQIEELKYVGVTTVEQLAAVSDGSPLMNMMGGVGLKQRAAAWVAKNRKSTVVNQTNAALAERDEQIAALQAQVAAILAAQEAARLPVESGKKTLGLSK